MSDDKIRIERAELFDRSVDEALAKERAGRERVVGNTRPVSPIRAFLMNPLIYLPIAAMLAAFAVWKMLEPKLNDTPTVRGDVVLINTDPFDAPAGMITVTIGSTAVYMHPEYVKYEAGPKGEPAFAGINEITVGTRVEVVGFGEGTQLFAFAIRPTTEAPETTDQNMGWFLLLFPLTGLFIALGLLVSEGLTTRNWIRMIERSLLGSFMGGLFAGLAYIPAAIPSIIQQHLLTKAAEKSPSLLVTVHDVSPGMFVAMVACRAAAWACIGAGLGVGMNLVRSTKNQLRNSVVGGALGGAFGGMFFDPVDRFFTASLFDGSGMSRLIGLLAVALSIGFFLALVERLGRDAWLRVRSGPLAGKSFVLYKTPTVLGSAPQADIYLYKDAEIDATHAQIHRVGTVYEVEDMGSRMGTTVSGNRVRRRRLQSGDQIIIGSTILDFEERQKRTPTA